MVLMSLSTFVLGVSFLYNDNFGLKAVLLTFQSHRVSLGYLQEKRCLVMTWCKHSEC